MTVPFSSYGAEIYLRGLSDQVPGLPTAPSRLEDAAREVSPPGRSATWPVVLAELDLTLALAGYADLAQLRATKDAVATLG